MPMFLLKFLLHFMLLTTLAYMLFANPHRTCTVRRGHSYRAGWQHLGVMAPSGRQYSIAE